MNNQNHRPTTIPNQIKRESYYRGFESPPLRHLSFKWLLNAVAEWKQNCALGSFFCKAALGAFALALSACVAPADLGWPKPELDYYHASTAANAEREAVDWVRAAPGHVRSRLRDGSRSMWPAIVGGDLLLGEAYTGQLLHPGLVVSFDRPAYPGAPHEPRCLHVIASISGDGRSVYMSGINNRNSDGWYPVVRINFILRRVVTQPHGETSNKRN